MIINGQLYEIDLNTYHPLALNHFGNYQFMMMIQIPFIPDNQHANFAKRSVWHAEIVYGMYWSLQYLRILRVIWVATSGMFINFTKGTLLSMI